MLSIILGCSLPFTILLLIALASVLCAQIIASDDSFPNNSIDTGCQTQAIDSTCPDSLNCDFSQGFATSVNNRVILTSDSEKLLIEKTSRHFNKTPPNKLLITNHYACPITSIEALRRRYGTSENFWGDWSNKQTRQFYRQQLPRALQIDGSLGLTLEERAKLASQARHALRIYSRERCHLPGRLLARFYDGIRHMQAFGSWSSEGMTWEEVKEKYAKEARRELGDNASDDDIDMFVHRRVVDRACATNPVFDDISASKSNINLVQIALLAKTIVGVERIKAIKNMKPPLGVAHFDVYSHLMDAYGALFRVEVSLHKLTRMLKKILSKKMLELPMQTTFFTSTDLSSLFSATSSSSLTESSRKRQQGLGGNDNARSRRQLQSMLEEETMDKSRGRSSSSWPLDAIVRPTVISSTTRLVRSYQMHMRHRC